MRARPPTISPPYRTRTPRTTPETPVRLSAHLTSAPRTANPDAALIPLLIGAVGRSRSSAEPHPAYVAAFYVVRHQTQ
jgi:hypothetical protein